MLKDSTNKENMNKLSYLIYGLGKSGNSVIKYFKKKKIKSYYVWDDNYKLQRKFYIKKSQNIKKVINNVDFIVLSPGVSLENTKFKTELSRNKNKIITDIDLLYLLSPKFKSIVVTGSNGKSTTCKIINHLFKKEKFKVFLGGNIGFPVLNFNVKKNILFVIEASSFQLSHSKFIRPDYALLLNISNDHIDWHGSMSKYIRAKFKIFNLQKKTDYALVNDDFKYNFKKKYLSKLVSLKKKKYKKIKSQIRNEYIKSSMNDQNMEFVYSLSKLFKIKDSSFIKAMNTFNGLPHRYEFFLKRKKVTFINDSKATTLTAAKFALSSRKNIYWVVGGLPKAKDRINLSKLRNNIIKSYIIGKNTDFFKKQLDRKVKFEITKNLKNSVIKALKDIRINRTFDTTLLLSPGAASFDQYKNFEKRGEEFKKICKKYAKKFI